MQWGETLPYLKGVTVCLLAILAVAFFSVLERKVLGGFQLRLGPNNVGFLQPFADAFNLLSKEESTVLFSSAMLYYISPSVIFITSLIIWSLLPSLWGKDSWGFSALLSLLLFSVNVYGVIFLGWFSNSNYAAIGCVRSTVQSLSYEVGLVLCVIFLVLIYGSSNFDSWYIPQSDVYSFWWMPHLFGIFILVLLVESNRTPFDLSEGESELVSGFCVEYGGIGYTLVFLSENLALLWVSVLLSASFFGSSIWGVSVCVFLCVLVRAGLPRIRFDSIMSLFWVIVLPSLISITTLSLIFSVM